MGQPGIQLWEAAYLQFETPEQEVNKFLRRLRYIGAESWPRDWLILDLFCGRGSGAEALRRMGFSRVHGVDLSERLVRAGQNNSSSIVADCGRLPIASAVADVAIIQGGLHHLPELHRNLELTLEEVRRALRLGGIFVMVEPWRTPFLDAVHMISRSRIARALSAKVDALATMIAHERDTYERWLSSPEAIMRIVTRSFRVVRQEARWGKLYLVGISPAGGSDMTV